MKQLKLTTQKGEFLVVCKDENGRLKHPDCEYIELGKLSSITEEQSSGIVDDCKCFITDKLGFIDYVNDWNMFKRSIESLHSLIKSHGYHLFENPYSQYEGIPEYHEDYLSEEQKTLYNPYIFKLTK